MSRWVAIFVGGAGRRMGGRPKGLLTAPGGGRSLLARLVAEIARTGAVPLLVGRADAYAHEAPEALRLDDAGDGPLGGMAAVVAMLPPHATVITVACDQPGVCTQHLEALWAAAPEAPAVVARRQGRWEPFPARWRVGAVREVLPALQASGRGSWQALCAALGATEIALDDAALEDWDRPEDVRA